MAALLEEPNGFHQQKTDFLMYVTRYLPRQDFGDAKSYQIELSAKNMLERDVYLGTPVLVDVDPESILSRTREVIAGFDDRSYDGLLAFLIASVHATAKALANDNKLRSSYVLREKEVHQIMDRLVAIDLSWINRILNRKILYLVSSREKNEIPLRFLLLEISHLLFHLSLVTTEDKLAKEGLEEYSREIDKNCNELPSEQFYTYYAGLRRDIREISLAFRYYNPKRISAGAA